MKKTLIIYIAVFLVSCDLINLKSEGKLQGTPVATVYDVTLYKEDIEASLPKELSKKDSLVFVKNIINTWAKNQILLKKAEENISENKNKKINELVKEYKESLFINDYKERLIKQQLDTVIEQEEIDIFYNKHKENFLLNKNLFKVKYIHFGKSFRNQKKIKEQFISSKEADLDSLETKIINYKSYNFDKNKWFTYEDIIEEIPPFIHDSKSKLLKISKLIKKEDSLGVYLVAVKEFRRKNEIAPQKYVANNIKEIILHKRKLELIREIEKTLINDAVKNKKFKEY